MDTRLGHPSEHLAGSLQLPLNNCGVMALDYCGKNGVATSIGHAPLPALINPRAGSRLAIGKALTNIIWAPLEKGLEEVVKIRHIAVLQLFR